MIGKHLWQCGSGQVWRAWEERRCAKCGAIVKLIGMARSRPRIFRTITIKNETTIGPMSKCTP
jgi:ribosomal protein L34E